MNMMQPIYYTFQITLIDLSVSYSDTTSVEGNSLLILICNLNETYVAEVLSSHC